jgi:hypothetical protein
MTEPATDEEIARLEADVASGAMIFEIRNHEMERILARIRAEREQAGKFHKALKPFLLAAEDIDDDAEDRWDIWNNPVAMNITIGDLRNVLALLTNKDKALAKTVYETCASVREQTVIECAQVARVWAQDRDLPYNVLTNVILALLDKKL